MPDINEADLEKTVEQLELALKVFKNDLHPSRYKEGTYLQQHAPIGCRVRRGNDWKWTNQDNGGPGTIVGHLYDELRKYWCWVEWDIGGDIDVYRWDVLGKCDLTIVDEDRVPVEGDIISVGCKVKPGDNYEGNSSHVLGIAIKRLGDNKVQVRWNDDGSREELTYGKEGTLRQLMLVCAEETKKKERSQNDADDIQCSALKTTSPLASPVFLKVDDVFETTATVRWKGIIYEKKSSYSKYVVTYIEKQKPQKKIVVDVAEAFFCILDDLKPGTEYSVDVKLLSDDGESLPTESSSFITRTKDTDYSLFEGWKLTDKEAARLAQALGENWEILAPALGIPNVSLHHIVYDNKTMTLCIYKMLLKWVENDKYSTFGKFCEVLKKNPNVYVDRSILNEMKEEYRLIIMEKENVQKAV
ncbi:uncharacterized protein LOC132722266 [Ruditapes philippinarum]|uniref:uncharacterized protein LOC132722266 n=1 Tax=Ruditapes philippinarum TaxID=129788 RepID=UPI00295BFB2F|nr:uncharacterized protein LOC132722266 [Ruditapes philippinarum]